MSKELDKETAKLFLKSLAESYFYYAKNKEIANQWYIDETGIKYDQKFLDIAASFESNAQATSIDQVDFRLNEKRIDEIKKGAEFAKSYGLLKNIPNVDNIVNQQLVLELQKELSE